MTNNNKKNIDFFGGDIVSNFDEVQKGLMPGHDLIFQTMEDVISFHFKRQESVDGWILDVGAGTGNDSMRVLQITEKKVDKTDEIIAKFKDMRILAIDSSTDMKNEFVNKFTQLFPEKTDGFEYLNKDITAITNDFIREKKYSNKCKIALSGYTLHHFHTDEKREIYQMMYDFLEPGGLLLNIDLFTFESNKIRQDAHNFDINYIKDNIND
ncbi:MAG: class I SAM-dependent methyltransferase [Clostridia bacterium]|nr:class I SAM-dependent methyltransferase [Clostridia bacterium]